MAESVVAFVVEKLGDLLLQKAAVLHELQDQVEDLKKELMWIQCFLRDAEAKQEKDERVRLWVSEIRQVAYDADDIIDRFILKAELQKQKSFFRRSISVFDNLQDLYQVNKGIQKLQTRIRGINAKRERYGVISIGAGAEEVENTRQWRWILPHSKEGSIIALEEDTAVLILLNVNGINHEELENIDRMTEDELLFKVYCCLESKRFLVVLDDIWSIQAWNDLILAFPNDRGSRLMLASRNRAVAMYADPQAKPYEPRCLTKEESWALFCQKAFPGKCCPDNLVEIGRQIVNKCGGLPLAVVVLGGLLLTKKTWEEWEEVHNNIEDSNIHAKKLIRLWVAEGFIPQEREGTMEGAAENCLNEVIGRCMVQVGEMSFGRIRTCRVHDVLRDFSVAKSKDEDFLEILSDSRKRSDKSRRYAIHSAYDNSYRERERYISVNITMQHLRSLLLSSYSRMLSTKHLDQILKEFKLLRILDFGNFSIEYLPTDIGKLIHLRYLGVRGGHLKRIPKSIGNLQSLQTLDMRNSYLPIVYCSLELPDVLWKMEELRHLLLDINNAENLRLGVLRNLQTILSIRHGKSLE
ncbi:Disease resistance protein [Thalictrum thalictroides]|uniref:Disease resistance protein n=1 Tax=Thalictrum thalictroides TaxID=46969 RepID=A0A7J6WUB8_THATH|nr:Disease resistance protein [Thalictrum thalictroides]